MSKNSDLLQTLQEMQRQLEQYNQRLTVLEKKQPTLTPQPRRHANPVQYTKQFFETINNFIYQKHKTHTFYYWLPFVIVPLVYFMSGIFISSIITTIVLLIYGLCAITAGAYYNYSLLRIAGYCSYIIAITWFGCLYKCNQLLHPHYWYIMHGMLACITGVLAATHFVMQKFYQRLTSFERRWIFLCITVALGVSIFVWGATTIILLFDYVEEKPSFFMRPFVDTTQYNRLIRTPITQFLLILYYSLVAILCCIADLIKPNRIFKGSGILLFIFATYNAWLLATRLRCPKTGYGLLIAVIACALLMIHAYRFRLHKTVKEVEE